jgi:8-oxo-dGTP pyrophosphatase MutT (NUDIX family)
MTSPERPTAVAAILQRADGRYLLIRRAPGRPAEGFWTPVTGRLEPGETPGRAAAREVMEEVGLAVRAGAIALEGETQDGRYGLVWVEVTLEDAAAARRPLTLKSDEVAEARWATPAEAVALEPMFPRTRAFFLSKLEPPPR